jgi:MarR family 2-MHQ and catechol resistance regulon transcriptional repressor
MPSVPSDALELLEDERIEAFGMLIEAHNELQNAMSRAIETDTDVRVAWLGVLIRLARSPDQRLRMSELARDMTMSTSGLTRLVDRVEAAGHVRREACPDDRRGLHAVLTPEGHAVIAAAAPRHLEDLERYLAGALADDELAELTRLLQKVRNHIRDLGGHG